MGGGSSCGTGAASRWPDRCAHHRPSAPSPRGRRRPPPRSSAWRGRCGPPGPGPDRPGRPGLAPRTPPPRLPGRRPASVRHRGGRSRQEFALADEICLLGAERMLAAALEAEVEAYVERDRDARDDQGRALVVRNGHARPRNVVAGAGALGARAPRVDDGRIDPATGKRHRFRSSILPPYIRRSPKVAEVLPLLYLHGLSTKDFVPALAEFFG